MHGTQMEVNIISDYDVDWNFNYTVHGLYQIENRNDNVYIAQTAGSQFMTSFDVHPYSDVVQGLTGIDWSSKGGVPFFQSMLGGLALAPNALACAGGAPTCGLQAPLPLGDYLDLNDYHRYPDVVIPWELGGIINDQNVLAKSTALYGEICFWYNK